MFECKLINIYVIENWNDMVCINDDEVNNTSEWNLLHDIIHPFKNTKILNTHYYLLLHGCMNMIKSYWTMDITPLL